MISRVIKKTIDLNRVQKVDQLEGPLYQLEDSGHTFEITCLMDGAAAAVSGTVSARFLRADETTVYFTGTLSGNVATITLPQSCYNVNGRFGMVVFIAGSDITTAVYAVAGSVYKSTSDTIIDPTGEIPSLEELIAQIEACEDATDAANAAAAGAVGNFAPAYTPGVQLYAGRYVIYDGNMYLITADLSATDNTGWSAVSKTQVTAGGELSDLKSAIDSLYNGKLLNAAIKQAMLNIFDHLVYTDGNAHDYIQTLKSAWAVTPTDAYLTATFNPTVTIYANTRLVTLRRYLTVKMWHVVEGEEVYDEITDYLLSGQLVAGKTCTVTVTYGNLTTTFNVTVALPADYQQVTYVGANGGSQFLRFGSIHPDSASDLAKYEIEIDCQLTGWDDNAATNMFFSVSSNAGCWFGYNNTVERIALGTASGTYFDDNKTYDRHQYDYYIENGTAYVSREDGTTIFRAVAWADTPRSFLNLFGFGGNNDYKCKCNVYSFTIYHNGTKIVELVPCYRKADNEIGFYDIVRNIFCTNNGTDAFVKGADV